LFNGKFENQRGFQCHEPSAHMERDYHTTRYFAIGMLLVNAILDRWTPMDPGNKTLQ